MNHESSTLDPLFATFDQFADAVAAYLPTLLTALAVLIAGIIAAFALKALVIRIGAALAAILRRASGWRGGRLLRLPWSLSTVVANVIFWLTIVFFLAVTSRILGLPGIADWIAGAARFLPHVLAASAIALGGYVLASFVRDTVSQLGSAVTPGGDPRVLAQLLYLLVNVVAALAALRQLGIDLVLVRTLIVIASAALFGGVAFAFGMGASSSLDNVIAGHYVRRVYRRGQRVRVGNVEGEILEITPTAVVLDTHTGRALVPARRFNQEVSVLLGQEATDDDR